MNIAVDRGLCMAAGNCALTAPSVFDQDEQEGLVVLLENTPDEDVREDVLDAVEMCPAQAIRVLG